MQMSFGQVCDVPWRLKYEDEEGCDDDEGYWDGTEIMEFGIDGSGMDMDNADLGLAGHPHLYHHHSSLSITHS